MNDVAFAAACRPARRAILRLLMLDYSIGHEIILQSRGNPLATATEEDFNKLTIEEQCHAVIEAAQVCSRTYDENKLPAKWVRLWGWFIRKYDFPLAIAEFRIYRAEGSTWPNITPPSDRERGRDLGSPFLARLLAYSGDVFGPECFDAPLGLIQWMYFAAAEAEGNCAVENEHEANVRAQKGDIMADIEREFAANQAKAKETTCPAS